MDAQTDRIYQSVTTNHRTRRSDGIRVSYRGKCEQPSLQWLGTLPALVSAVGRLICVQWTQSIKHLISKWPPSNAHNKLTCINSGFEFTVGSCWRECTFKPQQYLAVFLTYWETNVMFKTKLASRFCTGSMLYECSNWPHLSEYCNEPSDFAVWRDSREL